MIRPALPRLAALVAGCLLATFFACPAWATVESDIDKLLDSVSKARTDAEAEAKFREAETKLQNAGGSLDAQTRAFLEANIKRNRGTVGVTAWRRDRKQVKTLETARQYLRQAQDQYEKLLGEYSDKAEKIRDDLAGADPNTNPEFKNVWFRILGTKYWLAWTAYNLGMSEESTREREGYFSQAIEQFKAFTTEAYKEDVVKQCFRGQAMCLLEMRKPAEALDLLKEATEANTPPELYHQIAALRFKAYQSLPSADAMQQADAFAQGYFDSRKPAPGLDDTELRMAVEWAQYLATQTDPKTNPASYQAYKTRLDKVARLVVPYDNPWKAAVEALTKTRTTSPAMDRLVNARRNYDARQYREAVAEAQQGLLVPPKDENPQTFADLRYLILASYWNQKEWRSAHLAACDFLKAHKADSRARGDVCTRAFQAGLEALSAQPPLTQAEFQTFLDLADRDFRGVVDTQKAVYRQGFQMLQAKQFREAQRILAKVPVSSPSYRMAQYGIAYALFYESEGLAAQAKHDPVAVAGLLKSASEALYQFMTAPGQMSAEDEKTAANALNLAIIIGRRLLALPDPSPQVAATLVDRLDKWPWVGTQAAKKREALRLAISVRTGNVADAIKRVDGLLAKQDPTDSDLAQALNAVADPLEAHYDRCVRQNDAATASAVAERLMGIYSFLYSYSARGRDAASTEQTLATGRRLAHWLLRLERYDPAIQQYTWLLQKVPANKAADLMRGLALAYEAKKLYDKAIEQWGPLSRGLTVGSDDWFEARYHLVNCHVLAGHDEQAKKLMQEFYLLYPKGTGGDRGKPFEALGRKVGVEPPTAPTRP